MGKKLFKHHQKSNFNYKKIYLVILAGLTYSQCNFANADLLAEYRFDQQVKMVDPNNSASTIIFNYTNQPYEVADSADQ